MLLAMNIACYAKAFGDSSSAQFPFNADSNVLMRPIGGEQRLLADSDLPVAFDSQHVLAKG
jgi:hypothetical protein